MVRYVFSTEREKYEFLRVADMAPKGKVSVFGEWRKGWGNDVWVHVGYCKGDGVGIGVLIEPSYVCDESGEMIRINSLFPLEHRVCISKKDLENTTYNCPVVYDKDLFEVAEKPHEKIYAIKIVSQDMEGSANHGKDGAWIRAAEILRNYLRE